MNFIREFKILNFRSEGVRILSFLSWEGVRILNFFGVKGSNFRFFIRSDGDLTS